MIETLVPGLASLAVLALFAASSLAVGALLAAVSPMNSQLPIEVFPAIGVATIIFVGSVLNLLGIYGEVLFVALCLGPIAALAFLPVLRRRTFALIGSAFDSASFLPWLVLIAVFFFVPPPIDLNDDTAAYLAFVEKVQQTGGSGQELFSERRLNIFGGHFALMAPILAVDGLRFLGVIEPGLGLFLLGWQVSCYPAAPRPKVLASFAMAATVAAPILFNQIFSNPVINSVPVVLPAALLAAALWALQRWLNLASEVRERAGLLSLAAIIAAAALTFRPTPVVVVLALLSPFLVFVAARRRQVAPLMIGGVLALGYLAPFSIALFVSSHTLFFPYLGSGVHVLGESGEIYSRGSPVAIVSGMIANFEHVATAAWPLLMTLLFAIVGLLTSRAWKGFAWLGVGAVTFATISYGIDGYEVYRFTFTSLTAIAVVVIMSSQLETPFVELIRHRLFRLGMGVVACGLVVLAFAPALHGSLPTALRTRFEQAALAGDDFYSHCRNAQAAIPPGATMLVAGPNCVSGMDFRRNNILMHDWPGAAAPGGAFAPSGEHSSLRVTLELAGVDYIAWNKSLRFEVEHQDARIEQRQERQFEWLEDLGVKWSHFNDLARDASRGRQPVWADEKVEVYSVLDLR